MTAQKAEKRAVKNTEFEIAGNRVAPGESLRFDLPSAQLYTHTPLNMPIEVINGRSAGPVLLVCAAIHGDELNGVEIIRRLRSLKALKQLRGTLVLAPVVNLFGFIHKSRYLPDRRDLNRCFPGRSKGSLGSRIANLFFDEVVQRCSHAIDLHTGAVHRDNLPQVRAALDQPGVREMALGFSIPVIINSGLIDNSLRSEAGNKNIPIITYESGEALRLHEPAIVAGVRGCVGVMRELGMLRPSRSTKDIPEPAIAQSSSWFRASTDGMFRPIVKLGSRVMTGDALGVVTSPFSAEEEVIESRFEGIVIGQNNMPLVNAGEALFHVARFGAAADVEDEIAAHEVVLEADPLYEPEPVDEQIEDQDIV